MAGSDIKFDHTLGESFYNPRLQAIVDELRQKGIARESEGHGNLIVALCRPKKIRF